MSFLVRGYLEEKELPPRPSKERLKKKSVAYIECPQEIPCSPCFESCKYDAILMENINDVPIVDYEKCTGCMKCIRVCPGLAIFMLRFRNGKGYVTMPHEFLPYPKKGQKVILLNRRGEEIGEGTVTWILPPERNDKTALVTVEMDPELIFEARAFRIKGE
jgi:Fe-S-cluster-containing hydrogenase component 2